MCACSDPEIKFGNGDPHGVSIRARLPLFLIFLGSSELSKFPRQKYTVPRNSAGLTNSWEIEKNVQRRCVSCKPEIHSIPVAGEHQNRDQPERDKIFGPKLCELRLVRHLLPHLATNSAVQCPEGDDLCPPEALELARQMRARRHWHCRSAARKPRLQKMKAASRLYGRIERLWDALL